MSTNSPFKPGARCALRQWDNYTEVFVERIHKNGNFTLRGQGAQQWRPYSWSSSGSPTWYASKTGQDSWDRTSLMIWDATTDAEISAHFAERRLKVRLVKIQKRVEQLRNVPDSYLTALELALPPLQSEVKP